MHLDKNGTTSNRNNGPDQIVPCDNLTTVDPNGAVKIRMPESGTAIETDKPISAITLLQNAATKYPNTIAMYAQPKTKNGKSIKITYSEYLTKVRTVAKAFLKLGLERHHGVAILGFNTPEWFFSYLGAIFAGGIAVGIYTTNSPEACQYCIDLSKANIVVVEDEKQLQKILEVKPQLSNLKAIVQYSGTPVHSDVLSWERLLQIGDAETDDDLNKTVKTIAINECCSIVFTSGTVGHPKAAMLSHDNLIWDALIIRERLHLNETGERLVSYLPLSHVAAQVVDIFTVLTVAGTLYFADKDALKGSLLSTLLDVQPTRFLGVPRVWEKIYEKMKQVAAQNGPLKTAIGSWAKSQGLHHHLNKMNGIHSHSWGYALANALIFSKIKQALGFSRCQSFVSAAAPLSADIKKYFMSIDIPVMEAFGMSECAGGHTLCTENAFGFDTIGLGLPGVKTKIIGPDGNGHGEICMYGRHVFMGYLGESEKTDEVIDSEGYLHSGDIGFVDSKGLHYITGRIKELLITAGGENIAPVATEHQMKTELPEVSNVMLIGDRRKFLSLLITLKTEIDIDTQVPLDNLTKETRSWLKKLDCDTETVTEVLKQGPHPNLMKHIQEKIDNVNKKAISNAQRIQKFIILPRDFSVPTGEFGPTLKVKRNVVAKEYEDLIEKLYN